MARGCTAPNGWRIYVGGFFAPKSLQNEINCLYRVCVRACWKTWVPGRSGRPKMTPRRFQKSTQIRSRKKIGPREHQDAPRAHPRGAMRLPRGAQEAPRGALEAPRRHQEAPRGAQEAAKRTQEAPRGSKRRPRRTKRSPRGFQETPKSPQNAHKRLPRGSQKAPREPPGAKKQLKEVNASTRSRKKQSKWLC